MSGAWRKRIEWSKCHWIEDGKALCQPMMDVGGQMSVLDESGEKRCLLCAKKKLRAAGPGAASEARNANSRVGYAYADSRRKRSKAGKEEGT